MPTRIAINGFGRIGRCVARALFESPIPGIELVAINDLMTLPTAVHLFKYNSVHGIFDEKVRADGDFLRIDDRRIHFLNIQDPGQLPWAELKIDVVLECTGRFTDRAAAAQHLYSGAQRVLISGPSTDADYTVVMGINGDGIRTDHRILSTASCTTNCIGLMASVLDRSVGIEAALMSTVHAYTGDQSLVDSPHEDLRRARAATLSIIPMATGAAKVLKDVIPTLNGKIDCGAIRVPTANVSLVELFAWCRRKTSVAELNSAFEQAASESMAGYLACADQLLVSIDFFHRTESAIIDTTQTQVVSGRMVRICAWYDNEWGFSNRLCELARAIGPLSN